ncbi:MAG TPA: type II secretion system protein [Candidatus Saccharimonadaceae bacterium]|nr:type II secretion system protein [Candidatus Saccharimonadaceae bacterium]
MNVHAKKQQKGFTIIEVILVLAIAALIFLMVFIALPALQRGQRDTARKQDVGNIVSAMTNYISNNQGKMPKGGGTPFSYGQNMSSNTTSEIVQTGKAGPVMSKLSEIDIYPGFTCGGTDSQNPKEEDLTVGTANEFAVVTQVEAGGGSAFCQDNHS